MSGTKGWYSSEELAALLGVDESSVRRWRTCHPLQGPAFIRISPRRVIYRVADVENWLESQRVDPRESV